ncbi:type II toxin-antitoxin system RelE family toxin [Candidatus Leptofilum sp.]|uniref:type II toxin-antitoxin system RelE family toxin n=1 Tax=Candidatus Leptofilum sp. TaxID=3241576 RepID=UPI003B5A4E6B
MFDFKIAETKTFAKVKKKINPKLYQKINDVVYPQLRSNPYFGANIKKLKGEFEGFYRYRIGNYRLFYLIDNKKVFVFIVDLVQRKDAYK